MHQASVNKRDAVLEAIASSAVSLLRVPDPQQSFDEVLATLARATGVDRTMLFLIDPDSRDSGARVTAHYVWNAPGAQTASAGKTVGVRMSEVGLGSWVERLARGEVIAGPTRGFEPSVRALLERDGALSVAVVPVFVDGVWHGQIGFDDCRAERCWSAGDIDALRTVAELIGTAIARARDHERLADANRIIENSPTLLFRLMPREPFALGYVSANVRQYGYTADDLMAKPTRWFELIEPADRPSVLRAIQLIVSGRCDQSKAEFRWLRPDGTAVWFDARGRAVRDASGRLVCVEGIVNDVSERKLAAQQIEILAHTDALTGLANRVEFLERLEEAMAECRRRERGLAVMFIDLDGFKDVNDTLGHPFGDELLRAVARRLVRNVRDSDTVARFGGDEFAILQTEIANARGAEAKARELRRLLSAPYMIRGKSLRVTASIGLALYSPSLNGADDIMEQADLALYRAKADGRNRVRTYAPALDRTARERAALSTELRSAIADDELELHYQPQVELASGRIVGFEALLRWHHPERGLLLPSQFIPVAEASGEILPLGTWVLNEACRQVRRWRDQGLEPPKVAVNIAPGQLTAYPSFDAELRAILTHWQIEPEAIELELTESQLVDTSAKAVAVFKRLRRMGVKLAIDDFGTGYSSLNYLRAYQLSHIKIDRTFVKAVTENSDDATIVRATVGLARELGIDTIAEGIETTAQRAFLLNIGCRAGQGHLFGRPVAADAAARLLAERRGEEPPLRAAG